mgnify:CR=1 FL=1
MKIFIIFLNVNYLRPYPIVKKEHFPNDRAFVNLILKIV